MTTFNSPKTHYYFALGFFLAMLSACVSSPNSNSMNHAEMIDSSIIAPSLDSLRPANSLAAFFVNADSGSDSADGLSPETAWKTLDRVHNIEFKPGTIVKLARGSVWKKQHLLLDQNVIGTPQAPIVFESYGKGDAPTISTPRALWNKSQSFPAIAFSNGASYVRVLDIRLIDGGGETAIIMSDDSHHLTLAGLEISGYGTGIGLQGEHQKVLSNYIHDIGSTGDGSGIGIGMVGKDLEIAWNRMERCQLLRSGKDDGGAFEFYNYRSDVGYDYVSDSIRIHHNRIRFCFDFMESYGNATNMVIAYNAYSESPNEALEFHFDDSEHATWTHVCTYDVLIEHNTFASATDAATEGWGIIGLLVDWVPEHNPDTTQSHITFRNNIFATNYRVIAFKNVLGSSLAHDHNLYQFSGEGKPTNDIEGFVLDSTEHITDSLFADLSIANIQLRETSAAIDAGTISEFSTDILNNLVPTGMAPDIGAYEFISK